MTGDFFFGLTENLTSSGPVFKPRNCFFHLFLLFELIFPPERRIFLKRFFRKTTMRPAAPGVLP